MPLPREFAEPLERRARELSPLGSRVIWHAETRSTNADAVALAERGVAEGAIVLADSQTAGRGRLGRSWSSPAGAGIYASVLLRPDRQVTGLLSLAAGVAVADAIESATGLAPVLKWPNDVYLGGSNAQLGRKVAGILTEGGISGEEGWAVVGFGINVLPASLPAPVSARATSLEGELGRSIDRGELLAACLAGLAARYAQLRQGRHVRVIESWRRRASATFGRLVEWNETGSMQRGLVHGIDEQGGLLVSTPGGIARICSGELRWT